MLLADRVGVVMLAFDRLVKIDRIDEVRDVDPIDITDLSAMDLKEKGGSTFGRDRDNAAEI